MAAAELGGDRGHQGPMTRTRGHRRERARSAGPVPSRPGGGPGRRGQLVRSAEPDRRCAEHPRAAGRRPGQVPGAALRRSARLLRHPAQPGRHCDRRGWARRDLGRPPAGDQPARLGVLTGERLHRRSEAGPLGASRPAPAYRQAGRVRGPALPCSRLPGSRSPRQWRPYEASPARDRLRRPLIR